MLSRVRGEECGDEVLIHAIPSNVVRSTNMASPSFKIYIYNVGFERERKKMRASELEIKPEVS